MMAPTTETERKANRARCVTLYAHLRGCYGKLCEAYRTAKTQDGRYVYASDTAKDAWDRSYLQEVEQLCGRWYTDGINPDALPHPVQVALQLRNGRDISRSMAALGKIDFIEKVRARCARIGIKI